MDMYFRSAGADQHKTFMLHSPAGRKIIDDARAAIAAEQFQVAEKLLAPLVADGNAEALYLTALFSLSGEDEDTFEQRHLKQIQQASSKKFAPALFALGVYVDTGKCST